MTNLQQHIEALIFASEQSISLSEIVVCINAACEMDLKEKDIQTIINQIAAKYQNEELPMELVELAQGYLFLTKKQFSKTLSVLVQQKDKRKLSQSAMETLAIIAYKQPVTKTEIEQIRGVNCDYSVQKLLEKELISIEGKSDGPGRPILYGTSKIFMDYFKLGSIKDLPQLKDIQMTDNEIGTSVEN